MYYTVIKHSGHLRTLDKCRKHSPAARVFYISLVFSNDHRLSLLYLLSEDSLFETQRCAVSDCRLRYRIKLMPSALPVWARKIRNWPYRLETVGLSGRGWEGRILAAVTSELLTFTNHLSSDPKQCRLTIVYIPKQGSCVSLKFTNKQPIRMLQFFSHLRDEHINIQNKNQA